VDLQIKRQRNERLDEQEEERRPPVSNPRGKSSSRSGEDF
jgi:hypothetical protein